MESIAVAKFGGTSVKSIARIQHVAEIIKNLPQRKRLIVVSAMGDTTDHLIAMAKQCSISPDGRELDMLMATGEQVSIALLSLTLRSMGVKAKSFTGAQIGLRTDDRHTSARILEIERKFIEVAFEQVDVIIVAGFQGISSAGDITTLGRGGSDTSAVALAVACGSLSCDIYTDVDGICSADPHVVPDARPLRQISYGETLELARSGAQVIHPRAVELAEQYRIALRVRNTFNPDYPGTFIYGEDDMENYDSVCGVAIDRSQGCVSFKTSDASCAIEKLTDLIEANQISAEFIAQDVCEQNACGAQVSLVLKYCDRDAFARVVREVSTAAGAGDVVVDSDVAKISLVGRGLSGRPRYLAKFLACLSASGIEAKYVSSSDLRISCIVRSQDADRICQHLHSCFSLSPTKPALQLAATA